MDSTIQKKIKNFVRKYFLKSVLENKEKEISSNVMITTYFNRNMYNITSTDSVNAKIGLNRTPMSE